MKRLLLFIATEKGYTALRSLITNGQQGHIGAVITFREVNVEKDWSCDIESECDASKIPCFLWRKVKSDLIGLIRKYSITGAVAIAWRYLLPLTINQYLEDDLIIFHDSLLPKYRGFAPTPTAIICGETTIGVTALFATKEIDQGDIILQKQMHISSDMYINDIIKKQSRLYACMLKIIIEQMEANSLTAYPQNESDATYSIWRNSEDCHIDWSRSAKEIYDFIRAVGKPYPGAFTYMDEKKVIIEQAMALNYDLNFCIRDVGKIWRIADGNPEIICGKGMLEIIGAISEEGVPIQFNKVRCRLV